MYCKRCFHEVKEVWRYCPKCKNVLTEKTIEINQEEIIKKREKDKQGAIICMILFMLGILVLFLIEKYSAICFFLSLFSIVTGFIKYQNNIFIKILFWLFLISIVLYGIVIIILIFTCVDALSYYSCPGMG